MGNRQEACVVCGFVGSVPGHEVREPFETRCPCCGQFAVQEAAGASPARLRESWFLSGMPWVSPWQAPPDDWDPVIQLKSLLDKPEAT